MTIFLLMLALLGADLPRTAPDRAPSPTVKGADLELLREVRDLATRIAKLRGQDFDRSPVAVRAPGEVRRRAAEVRAAGVLSAERLAARGRAWADIGLGSSETPRSLLLRLAADLEGVTWDPSAGRLLVDPGRLTPRDFQPSSEEHAPSALLMATGVRPDEPLVGHMLMHLRQRERSGADHLHQTTDRLLAEAAWLEGEANLVAIRFLFRTMGIANDVLEAGLDPGHVLDGDLLPSGLMALPGVEGRLLRFVYHEGFAQIADAHNSGGWEAIDSALAARRTTRDLLHPEYSPLRGPATPAHRLSVPDEYHLVDRDALGEQAVVVLVATHTGKDNLGLLAGDGWNGDALYRWEKPGGGAADSGLTLWVTRWSSEEAASDFEYGYARSLRARFPGLEVAQGGEGRRLLDAGQRVFRVDRAGQEIRVRIAPRDLDQLLEATPPAEAEEPARLSRRNRDPLR